MCAVGSASAEAAPRSAAAASAAAASAVAASAADAVPAVWSGALPADVLSYALAGLAAHELARLASTCRYMWRGASGANAPGGALAPGPAAWGGPVEEVLRARAAGRGLCPVAPSAPGAASRVPHLARLEERARYLRHTPLAMSLFHRLLVDGAGRLRTWSEREDYTWKGVLRGHARPATAARPGFDVEFQHVAPGGTPPAPMQFESFQPVPSMRGVCVVSVAGSGLHSLALGAGGEVYSWGFGADGALGHGDELPRWTPCRIAALERAESVRATCHKSAAVGERGRLWTCGKAFALRGGIACATGLGHPLERCTPRGTFGCTADTGALLVLTPLAVEGLAGERVVGVALGESRMLAVLDTGAVCSRGVGPAVRGGTRSGEQRFESVEGRHFVAVAVGLQYNYALAETGELYAWTRDSAPVPIMHSVKLMVAEADSELVYAVTEEGAVYSWCERGSGTSCRRGGSNQTYPRVPGGSRPALVHALGGVPAAALAFRGAMAVVADEGGELHCTRRIDDPSFHTPHVAVCFLDSAPPLGGGARWQGRFTVISEVRALVCVSPRVVAVSASQCCGSVASPIPRSHDAAASGLLEHTDALSLS